MVFDRILGLMPRCLFLLGKDYGEGGERQLSIAIWLFILLVFGRLVSYVCLTRLVRPMDQRTPRPPCNRTVTEVHAHSHDGGR